MNLRSPLDTLETLPDEWLIERMRKHRNRLLAASDWTMHSDAPTDKTAWATYRQALRDFPATWEPSETADFPVSPDYVEPIVEETTTEEEPVVEETPVVHYLVEGEQPQIEQTEMEVNSVLES
jgi:hypothetical protein